MTEHLANPQPTRRAPGRLVAVLLALALMGLGCDVPGGVQSTDGSAGGLLRVRSAGEVSASGPFDVDRPAIGNLDPDLLDALQSAARDARDDGVRMVVNSGWRSPEHQERLFTEAVNKYGSEEEARRWVSTPDSSAHVTGDAVDVGPTVADDWLSRHGSDYGLCQTFANEIWHYELSASPGGQCPDMYPDSSYRN